MIALVCAWIGLFASYLVFAGQASTDELVAGAICAAAASLWWAVTRRASAHRFAFDQGCWAAAGRAWLKLPRATLSVAQVLLRALGRPQAGAVDRRFYAHGRRADPAECGRRAVGVLAASLAPDSFVLRTPADREEIVVHGLTRGEPTNDPRWPI